MKRTLLLAAALVALLAPAGSVLAGSGTTHDTNEWEQLFDGAPGHMDIIVGPDAVRFQVEQITIDGEQAAQLRQFIDSSPAVGDGDHEVSQGESDTFEAFVTAAVNARLPDSFDLDMVTMDGRTPYREEGPEVHIETLKIHDAAGEITDTSPITADLSVLLRFETVTQGKTTHHLRLENLWGDLTGYDLDEAPDMEIRVQGYRSWTIQEDSIRPTQVQERYHDGVLVFTGEDASEFKEQGQGLEFEIEGDPSHQILGESEESPVVAPLIFIGVALVGLIALRRRQ